MQECKITMSTVSKGLKFENQVAEIYRLMGYEVKQNVGVLGHQIDIILTYTMPDGTRAKTAVECKYVEGGNLKKNDVMKNINALEHLKNNHKVQNLIIVTTEGFAKNIWDAAQISGIKLLTIRELQAKIINFDSYVNRIIYDFEHWDEYKDGQRKPIIELFERANLCEYYVHLRCRDSNDVVYDPIDKYIEDWLSKGDKNHITLLGDYGTGKSSFLLYLTYVLAKSFKDDPFNIPVPIFISLKNYNQIKDIKGMIMDVLKNDYNIIIHSSAYFQNLLEDGKLILLLDGFDEMESKSNKDIILKNFDEIAKLVTKNSKVVLTSRTHYFKTHSQVKDIFNPQYDTDLLKMIRGNHRYEIMELLEFNNEQIIEFLHRHTDDYMEIWRKIKSTYNLEDLSKRPILLEMIIRSLPALLKAGREINSSRLYEVYTDMWVQREDWRSVMNRDEKTIFMEELSLHMFLNDIQSVNYNNLNQIVLDHFKRKITSKEDADVFDTDTRTCSFLNRDYNGNYKFIHKSFMEFFVAKKFCGEVTNSKITSFKEKPITPEIIDFISKLNPDNNKLYDVIYLTSDEKCEDVKYMGGNAISILKAMGETFANKDFSNTILQYADFENTVCDSSNFSNADLRNSKFIDASLLYTNFKEAKLDGTLMEDMGYVSSISIDSKNKHIAFGTMAGYVIIVDLTTFKKTSIVKKSNRCIKTIKFFGGDEFVGFFDSDKQIFVFDTASYEECIINEKTNNEWADFHPSNAEIVILSSDGRIKIIDIKSKIEKVIDIKNKNDADCTHVSFLDDSNLCVINSINEILIIDSEDGIVLKSIKSQLEKIDDVDYNPDDKLLFLRQIINNEIQISGLNEGFNFYFGNNLNWSDLSGKDSEKLRQFLKQNYGINWVDTARIRLDSNGTIKVNSGKNYLSLILNSEKTKINLILDDGRTDEFLVEHQKRKNTYIRDNKYEIIDIENNDSNIINAGSMGTISTNSILKFSIEFDENEINEDYAIESGSMFRITDLKTNENLKESYNASLKMTYSINRSHSEEDDKSNLSPPAVVFSKDSKSVYISDYSGKLLWWNWSKEPSLESKVKREKWGKDHWRVSITKTMLESKYINENLFKCDKMVLDGVTGLSKEKIQSLKRSGAIIPTIFDDNTKNIK